MAEKFVCGFFSDIFCYTVCKKFKKGDLWFKSDNSKLVLETLFCKTRGKRICTTRNSNNNEKLLLAIPLDYTRNVSYQTWFQSSKHLEDTHSTLIIQCTIFPQFSPIYGLAATSLCCANQICSNCCIVP